MKNNIIVQISEGLGNQFFMYAHAYALSKKLDKILTIPYEIVDHKAAIRPSTIDRRPFLGLHPEHNCLGILNGLGTKGASLAPYFVNQFVEFLLEKRQINKEANIDRFKKKD